jgi:membrane associated rhomboid family serine protease
MLVYGYRERHHLARERADAMKAQAALGIALMLLLGLVMPNLNNWAHAGGLVAGALIACVLPTAHNGTRSVVGWRSRMETGYEHLRRTCSTRPQRWLR